MSNSFMPRRQRQRRVYTRWVSLKDAIATTASPQGVCSYSFIPHHILASQWPPVAHLGVKRSMLALYHHLLDFCDRFGRIEVFRARGRTIHDGMAPVQAERIFQIIQPFAG